MGIKSKKRETCTEELERKLVSLVKRKLTGKIKLDVEALRCGFVDE